MSGHGDSRRKVSWRAGALAAFAFVVSFVVPTALLPARAAPPEASDGYYVAVSGADLDPNATYTPQQLADKVQASGGSLSPGEGAPVQPMAAVAQGYILFDPGRVNGTNGRLYIYDSDWGVLQELYCKDGCRVQSKWKTQVHLYLNGNTSKSWTITLNAKRVSGYSTVSFDYYYECAINVAGAADHKCAVGNGADPSDSGAMNPGETLHRYLERNAYSNTEYAQVAIGVQFLHTYLQNKDRLADVCGTATRTKLCPTTGQGAGGGTHTW